MFQLSLLYTPSIFICIPFILGYLYLLQTVCCITKLKILLKRPFVVPVDLKTSLLQYVLLFLFRISLAIRNAGHLQNHLQLACSFHKGRGDEPFFRCRLSRLLWLLTGEMRCQTKAQSSSHPMITLQPKSKYLQDSQQQQQSVGIYGCYGSCLYCVHLWNITTLLW